MCAAGWLYAFVIASPIMVWYLPASFDAAVLCFDFEVWNQAEFTWNNTNGAMGGAMISCSFLLYMITITSLGIRQLKKKVKKVTPASNAASTTQNLKPEVKLLIQCILRFSQLVAILIFANVQQAITIWFFYGFAMLNLAVCLNTTVVTICLNNDIREEVGKMLFHWATVAPTMSLQNVPTTAGTAGSQAQLAGGAVSTSHP